jgi:hypothetical protein
VHNRIGRLVAAVIAAVLTLLAAPVTEAIAIAPAESLSTYACDGHHHPALVTGVVTERGPPAVHRLLTTRDAADPWSPGASVCSDERPSRAVATYDDPARFVKVARATSTTDGRVEVISVCPFDFERGRGAAKTESYVYRGVSRESPAYGDALEGNAVPRNVNGATTAEAHNYGNPSDLADSPFTSWSRDPAIARIHAGEDGVILRLPTGKPPAGSTWKFEWSPDVWFEQEVLVRGPVYGAGRIQ